MTYLLPRLIGASRAFDLIVTGRTVDADAAEHLGIVSQVFDDDGFLDAALGVADGIAAYTGIGLRMTKEVMWANLDTPEHGRVHRAREPQPGHRGPARPRCRSTCAPTAGASPANGGLTQLVLDQLEQIAVGIAHERQLHLDSS